MSVYCAEAGESGISSMSPMPAYLRRWCNVPNVSHAGSGRPATTWRCRWCIHVSRKRRSAWWRAGEPMKGRLCWSCLATRSSSGADGISRLGPPLLMGCSTCRCSTSRNETFPVYGGAPGTVITSQTRGCGDLRRNVLRSRPIRRGRVGAGGGFFGPGGGGGGEDTGEGHQYKDLTPDVANEPPGRYILPPLWNRRRHGPKG